jgi:ATP-dependent DNA helicase PIF1
MAPTGKAALNASGVTLHSNNGLSIPILSLGKGNDLKGDALLRLQQRFEHISAIIIDERSMLSLVDFYWIDRRCRQATKQSHKPFGGLPIAFIGDPGQLPPVGGLSLWEDKTSQNTRITGIQAIASELYKRINTVMNLTEVRRQENQTSVQFLNRLRDGKCTEIDWQWLQHNCTAESIKQRLGEQAFKDKFQSSNTLHIYFRNADTNLHNIEQIQSVRNPILLINAKHDSTSSKQRSTEHTQHLPAKIYLCPGAKIMLLRNISTVNGLVNGSTGTVIDFLYEEAQTAPTLPYSILINFPDYNGTPFFTAPGQEKWVPILNERYSWGENNQHYRISFPITLCYAITAWKSQGMTLTVPVYTKLGNKEPEHGCTYVVLSRPKDLENLCIHNGITLDRITTAISNGKKLKRRLKEDNRLQDLYQQTRERFMHVFL